MLKKAFHVGVVYSLVSFKHVCAVPWLFKLFLGTLVLTSPGGLAHTTIDPQFEDSTHLYVMGEAAIEWNRDSCDKAVVPHENCVVSDRILREMRQGKTPNPDGHYPVAVTGAAYAFEKYRLATTRNKNVLSGVNHTEFTNVLLRAMLSDFNGISEDEALMLAGFGITGYDSTRRKVVFDTYQLYRIHEALWERLGGCKEESYETPWDTTAQVILGNVQNGENSRLFNQWKWVADLRHHAMPF